MRGDDTRLDDGHGEEEVDVEPGPSREDEGGEADAPLRLAYSKEQCREVSNEQLEDALEVARGSPGQQAWTRRVLEHVRVPVPRDGQSLGACPERAEPTE